MKSFIIIIMLSFSVSGLFFSLYPFEKKRRLCKEFYEFSEYLMGEAIRKMRSVRSVTSEKYLGLDGFISRFSSEPEIFALCKEIIAADTLPLTDKNEKLRQITGFAGKIYKNCGEKSKENLATSLCFYPAVALIALLVIL